MSDISVEFSPVLIIVYNRFEHFKRCIEAVKSCEGACETDLFIASDQHATIDHFENVCKIREYSKLISGFKSINLIAPDKNQGALKNYENARAEIFRKYDKLIAMEDDVVVGKGFLLFINKALQKYKHDPKVLAVSGYLPPGVNSANNKIIFLNRLAPYGMGLWRDKILAVEAKKSQNLYKKLFLDNDFFISYEKYSPNSVRTIPLLIHTNVHYSDYEIGIIMQQDGLLALYPPTSITKSIGFDGSGLHSGNNNFLQNQNFSNLSYIESKYWDSKVVLNNTVAIEVANFRRTKYMKFTNYIIFYINKFMPSYIHLYKLLRLIYHKLK